MRKYIQSLDGIRGFGIIFVLLYHFLRLNGKDWSVMGFSWILDTNVFCSVGISDHRNPSGKQKQNLLVPISGSFTGEGYFAFFQSILSTSWRLLRSMSYFVSRATFYSVYRICSPSATTIPGLSLTLISTASGLFISGRLHWKNNFIWCGLFWFIF
jgi:hypothetical protein